MARDEREVGSGDAPRAGGHGPVGMGLVNALLLGAAGVVIVAGYVLLDHGSVTAAPILLAVGYAVLIPAGLLFGYRRAGGEDS